MVACSDEAVVLWEKFRRLLGSSEVLARVKLQTKKNVRVNKAKLLQNCESTHLKGMIQAWLDDFWDGQHMETLVHH